MEGRFAVPTVGRSAKWHTICIPDIATRRFETYLTFAVTPDGDLLDAETLERLS